MKILTQSTSRSVQYEVEPPTYPPSIYGRDQNSDAHIAPIALAFIGLTLIISTTLWIWFLWRLLTKAGYRGFARGLWLTGLIFPLTSSIGMIAFALVTWPIQEQLMKAQAKNPTDDIDEELNRLKRGL